MWVLRPQLLVRVDDDLEVNCVALTQRGKGTAGIRSGALTEPGLEGYEPHAFVDMIRSIHNA